MGESAPAWELLLLLLLLSFPETFGASFMASVSTKPILLRSPPPSPPALPASSTVMTSGQTKTLLMPR